MNPFETICCYYIVFSSFQMSEYLVELPEGVLRTKYRSNILQTLNYYQNTLHLANPKYLGIPEIFAYFDSPSDRPSMLKGVDLIMFDQTAGGLDDRIYDIIMYAIEEEVNSVHIALIDIDDGIDVIDNISEFANYIIRFNKTRGHGLPIIEDPQYVYTFHYTHRLRPIETTKGMYQSKYIPRKWLDYYKSLTIHAFDNDGVLLM